MSEFAPLVVPSSTDDCTFRRVIILRGKIIIVTERELIALDGTDLRRSCCELCSPQVFNTAAVSENGQFAVFTSVSDNKNNVYVTDGEKWIVHSYRCKNIDRDTYHSSWIDSNGNNVVLVNTALCLYRWDESGLKLNLIIDFIEPSVRDVSVSSIVTNQPDAFLISTNRGEIVEVKFDSGSYVKLAQYLNLQSESRITSTGKRVASRFIAQHTVHKDGLTLYGLVFVDAMSGLEGIFNSARDLFGSMRFIEVVTFHSSPFEPCLFVGSTECGKLVFFERFKSHTGGLRRLDISFNLLEDDFAQAMCISTTLNPDGTQSLVVLGQKGVHIFAQAEISKLTEVPI